MNKLFTILLILVLMPAFAPAQQFESEIIDPRTGETIHAAGENALDFLETDFQSGLMNETIDPVTHIQGGTSRSAISSGDLAFFNDGPTLVILDISDNANPVVLSETAFPELISEIALMDDFAFIGMRRTAGVISVDISDPSNPEIVDSAAQNAGALAITAGDGYVYAGFGPSGSRVFEVDESGNLEQITTIPSSGSANGIDVRDGLLAIADGNGGYALYDVSNPAEPELLSSEAQSAFVTFVRLHDERLYLAGGVGFKILDISDTQEPELLGQFSTSSNSFGFQVVGDYAYLSGVFGFLTLDISDPSDIQSTFSASTGNSVYTFADEDNVYHATQFFGLQIYDRANPAEPELVSEVENLGFVFNVAVEGDYAYIMDIVGKVRIMDLSDPLNPVELSSVVTNQNSQELYIFDNLLFVADADANGGITVVDISDKTNPVIIADYISAGQSNGLQYAGDRTYLADGFGGLRILDSSDLNNISQISDVFTGGNSQTVRVDGDFAHVANFGGGYVSVDISDEANPVVADTYLGGSFMSHLEIDRENQLIYLVDAAEGFAIIDYSDPADLELVTVLPQQAQGRDLSYHESGYVAYADEFFGAIFYDVSDAENFSEIGRFAVSERVTGAAAGERHSVFAATDIGIYIFESPMAEDEEFFAQAQIIHNAADPALGSVDIYLNGELAVDNFEFQSATPYIDVPAETEITIEITAAGEEDVLLDFTGMLDEGQTYTIIAQGVGNPDDFAPNPDGLSIDASLEIIEGTLTESVTDLVELLLFHGVTDAPTVDVLNALTGNPIATGLSYTDASDYVQLPPDVYFIDIAVEMPLFTFEVDVTGLTGQAVTVLASGFVDPDANQDGEAFTLIAVLADGTVIELETATSIDDPSERPDAFILEQNYPNPFNPVTQIQYTLPESADVTLEVFNLQGQRIAVLENGHQSAGTHSVTFDGTNMASGLYLYRLQAGDFTDVRKMMMVK